MQLIDGTAAANTWISEIAQRVQQHVNKGFQTPHLAAVLIGSDGASQTYVNNKIKACKRAGFKSTLIHLNDRVTQQELLQTIDQLNGNSEITGFIVQLPLPSHINETEVINQIDPNKDVDGFHPINVGRMVQNQPGLISATPLGILKLLQHYNIKTEGQHCVIVGRSLIVGKPLSILLTRNAQPGNCTVTLCHSKTQHLESFTQTADILVCAMGQPEQITGAMISEKTIIIDVGTTRVADSQNPKGYRLCGDVNFKSVASKCKAITPVPGGVGPMTIAALLHNTMLAAEGLESK